MTSEDLLQPGHVVKERWKVVSYMYTRVLLSHHNTTLTPVPTEMILTGHWCLMALLKSHACNVNIWIFKHASAQANANYSTADQA
jgi:hypothetical protein